MREKYVYNAIVSSIYDGDTIKVDIDLGFDFWWKEVSLRLYGINTPEIRGPERPRGLVSKTWLEEKIPVGTEILVETIKDRKGKYGRYLAILWLGDENLNEELVKNGLAERYFP